MPILLLCALLLSGCRHSNPRLRGVQREWKRIQWALQQQQDEHAALHLMPLARQGYPHAQYALGYLYFYGRGVPLDEKRGLEYIQKAAKQGYPAALKALELLKEQSQTTQASPGQLK